MTYTLIAIRWNDERLRKQHSSLDLCAQDIGALTTDDPMQFARFFAFDSTGVRFTAVSDGVRTQWISGAPWATPPARTRHVRSSVRTLGRYKRYMKRNRGQFRIDWHTSLTMPECFAFAELNIPRRQLAWAAAVARNLSTQSTRLSTAPI